MRVKLTKVELEVIKLLFFLRGLTADDVTAFRLMSNDFSLSLQKSTYNILRRLAHKKIVIKQKSVESEFTVYTLSKKGLDIAKDILQVPYASDGNGLLPIRKDTTIWDVPYNLYAIPRRQLYHYLMINNCIRALIPLRSEIRLQTAYYSNLNYTDNDGKAKKVKPDFSITINEDFYCVEVDTGSESKHQLQAKFQNYKRYAEYCSQNANAKKVHTILFVVKNATETNLNRRWLTVIEAFYSAFEERLDTPVNLIFATVDEFCATVQYEIKRKDIESFYKVNIGKMLSQSGYTRSFYCQVSLETNQTIIFLNDSNKTYKPCYLMINQKRETRFYFDKYSLKQAQEYLITEPFPAHEHYGYKYDSALKVFRYYLERPVELLGLSKTKLSKLFVAKLTCYSDVFEMYKKA